MMNAGDELHPTIKDYQIRASGAEPYRAVSVTGPNIPHGTGCTFCQSCS
jgi:hypothetical protein